MVQPIGAIQTSFKAFRAIGLTLPHIMGLEVICVSSGAAAIQSRRKEQFLASTFCLVVVCSEEVTKLRIITSRLIQFIFTS